MNSLSVFLQLLEDMDSEGLHRFEWEQSIGKDFNQLENLFLTKKISASKERLELDTQFSEEVLKQRLGPAPCGGTWRDEFSRHLLRPAWDWIGWEWHHICKVFARALGLNLKHVEFIRKSTHQIAELGNMPVLLSIHSNAQDLLSATAQMTTRLNEPFIVLAPTRRYHNVKLTELLLLRRAGFFDLESILVLQKDGSLIANKSGGQLFSSYLPEQLSIADQNEAVRLFQLFKELSSEPKTRKARLEQVFPILVLEKKSQAETAKICKCSPALITARAKEIENRMGKWEAPLLNPQQGGDQLRQRFLTQTSLRRFDVHAWARVHLFVLFLLCNRAHEKKR